MKKYIVEFTKRGFIACGFGPLVLAVVYLVIQNNSGIDMLSVKEVTMGIFSLSALAFVVGGMNVVYQIERLPLMLAILLHGGVLYAGYLITYLLNGWLARERTPIVVFTCIFIVGYMAIWAVIYFVTRKNTAKINEMLNKAK